MRENEVSRDAWQRYVSTGAIPQTLRGATSRAWERAHDFGVNPRQFQAQILSEVETERLLGRMKPFIDSAKPYMTALSHAAGGERHAVMLGDSAAVVLDVVGDEQSVRGPQRVPGPGSLLSEEVTGCNGVGSPLAENGYVEWIGSEHFIGGFHPFTCQGIAVHDGESVVGVLSTSVRRLEASRRLQEILICSARGIEAELLSSRLQQKVERVLRAHSEDTRVLEDLRQDVVQSYAAAKLRLQVAARSMRENRQGYALQLVSMAQEAIASFRHDAMLWQDLASSELGAAGPVELLTAVREILELLQTEMQTRGVTVVERTMEPITVGADRREVVRQVLRHFLLASEWAGSGGGIELSVGPSADRASGRVSMKTTPGIASLAGGNREILLSLPRVKEPIRDG